MHRRSLFVSGLAAVSALGAGAGLAGAHPTPGRANHQARALSHPFAAWGDHRAYFRAPGAAFAAGRSVSVRPGHSVSTPAFSGAHVPSLRFVDTRHGAPGARLAVALLVRDGQRTRTVRLAELHGRSRAQLAPSLRVPPALQRELNRTRGTLRLRFSAVGRADWSLTDVYIDPILRCGPNNC